MPVIGSPGNDAMDVDPVDDGPIPTARNNLAALVGMNPLSKEQQYIKTGFMPLANVEDPKLAIEMLRSEDMSTRVAAAHKLDLIAIALGPQRAREVRYTQNVFVRTLIFLS